MKSTASICYALFMCVFQLQAASREPLLVLPPQTVCRGEPSVVLVMGQARHSTMTVTYSDGRVSPLYGSIAMKPYGKAVLPLPYKQRDVFFLFSVPITAALGEARIHINDAYGTVVASSRFEVLERIFDTEDLHLTPSLTAIRTQPDPRKTEQAIRYQALLSETNSAAVYLDAPFIQPVQTERRTTLFGLTRRYLYANGTSDVSFHNGIDYGCPTGTSVIAAGRGRVAMAEDRIVTGKTVILEHLPGVYSIYMHLDAIRARHGDIVERGKLIGTVGKTGLATGPHLHWELRIMGVACDPEAFIDFQLPEYEWMLYK